MPPRPGADRFLLRMGLLVALGLALRAYHYLRQPSLWHDEGAVVLNVLDKSFLELLGPLRFTQAAPPLFLWAEKAAGLVLGDTVYGWRLLPFLASCAALVLLAGTARRVLKPGAALWAVFLFACSDRALWHACEAKPYAVDLLAAAAVTAAFCATRSWSARGRVLLYAALTPLLIFASYPGLFLCGGVLAALLPAVAADKKRGTWLAFGLLGLAVAGSFALLMAGPVHAQRNDDLIWYWQRQLPCWDRPWTVPRWTVFSTFEMFRYCCKPAGGLLAPLAVVGGVGLWRSGQKGLVLLLAVPIGLALAAAYLRHYPFGHTRLELYATPAVVLLVAAGATPALGWLRERNRACAAGLAALLLSPLALSLWRVAEPWPRPDATRAAAFVLARRLPGDQVCGSHCDHDYCFRRLGARYGVGKARPPETVCRLWVVTEGQSPQERLRLLRERQPDHWRVIDRCDDFPLTSIFLLTRPGGEGKQRAENGPRLSTFVRQEPTGVPVPPPG